jgi:peroxiredoxin
MILICLTSVSLAYPNNGYEIGDKATDFSLKNVDGNFVSMSDYEDANGYVVIFTCNTCPWAQKYEDRINALHEKLTPKGFPVIAINPNDPAVSSGDSFEQMKLRAAEKGFEFPYLFDAGQVVFPQYGATRTPHVFVLDKNLVVKYIGAIDDNPQSASSVEVKYVENAVMAVQAGEMPDPGVTKAIGCGIKVKA